MWCWQRPTSAETSAWVEQVTGVGSKRRRPPTSAEGTYNTLCSFGTGSYLEIIGPDPDQPEPDRTATRSRSTLWSTMGWPAGVFGARGLDELATRGAEFDVAFIGPFRHESGRTRKVASTGNYCSWAPGWILGLSRSSSSGARRSTLPRPPAPGLALASLTAQHPEPQRVLAPPVGARSDARGV